MLGVSLTFGEEASRVGVEGDAVEGEEEDCDGGRVDDRALVNRCAV